jgi:hypothetical protein
MKFTWFNLMPWPYLPDDFREKHRSVWVDIPNTLYDPKKGTTSTTRTSTSSSTPRAGLRRHRLQRASPERLRAHAVAELIAATLSRRTSRAALCVIGNSIAGYNPPIRVAEEFAMLDVISGGRLIAGFPSAPRWTPTSATGRSRAHPRQVPRGARPDHEGVGGDEPFAFDGKYNQLRWVNCWPKPIQKPHPPIYIPGGGSIETWDFCLDHDYNYSYLSFFGYLRGKSLLDGYWERVAKRGKDESPYRAPSRRSSAWRTPTRRPRSSTPSTASTSSTAACTSSHPSPIRRATARWPR